MHWQAPNIKVVVVDDEQSDREKTVHLLSQEDDMAVVGMCSTGSEAIEQITSTAPDLLFLDVRTPQGKDFAVLEGLRSAGINPLPVTIITSVQDLHAAQMPEHHAFDFLLKPFSREHFRLSLRRAREQLVIRRSDQLNKVLASALGGMTIAKQYNERLVFKSNNRFVFLKVREIRWIASEGNYLRIHTRTGNHLVRETMKRIEQKLNPDVFLRIHRSTIVNLGCVKEIQPWLSNGESAVLLEDEIKLPLSRGYRHRISHLAHHATAAR